MEIHTVRVRNQYLIIFCADQRVLDLINQLMRTQFQGSSYQITNLLIPPRRTYSPCKQQHICLIFKLLAVADVGRPRQLVLALHDMNLTLPQRRGGNG